MLMFIVAKIQKNWYIKNKYFFINFIYAFLKSFSVWR